MLVSAELLGRKIGAELGVLELLEVSEEVLLSLTALIVAILLRVHGKLEELFVVLTILPSVLVHLLAE